MNVQSTISCKTWPVWDLLVVLHYKDDLPSNHSWSTTVKLWSVLQVINSERKDRNTISIDNNGQHTKRNCVYWDQLDPNAHLFHQDDYAVTISAPKTHESQISVLRRRKIVKNLGKINDIPYMHKKACFIILPNAGSGSKLFSNWNMVAWMPYPRCTWCNNISSRKIIKKPFQKTKNWKSKKPKPNWQLTAMNFPFVSNFAQPAQEWRTTSH